MNRIVSWLKGLIGLIVVVGFAAALAWLLRSGVQPVGQVSEEPTSPIVTTPQPTWTPPTEQELRLTVVTPDAPPQVTATQAGSTPLPTPTFPPQTPTVTPGPPTATATPLPERPSPIATLPPLLSKGQRFRILFGRSVEPAGWFTINADGSDERPFPIPPREEVGAGAVLNVSVAPDGSHIAFDVVEGMEGISSIWVMSPDGTDRRLLVVSDEDWLPMAPVWSPNGKEIAYIKGSRGNRYDRTQLWKMRPDGSESQMIVETPFTIQPGPRSPFQWTTDGYIYHVSREGGVYAVNPETGELTQFMDRIDYLEISISPDAQKMIVGSSVSTEKIQLARMQPVNLGKWGSDALWSPDSTQVAFVVAIYELEETGEASGRTAGLWVKDISTGQEKLLVNATNLPQWFIYPEAWSPDGTILVYSSYLGIFVVDVRSGESHLVVSSPIPDAGTTRGSAGFDFKAVLPLPAQ